MKVNDISNGQYSVNKKTPRLRSNLCYYIDAYIVVKGTITVAGANVNNQINKELACKNNAPFRSCISKTQSYTMWKILILLWRCIVC